MNLRQGPGPWVIEATYLADLSQPAFVFWSKEGTLAPLLPPGGDRVPIPWPVTDDSTAPRDAVLVPLPEALSALIHRDQWATGTHPAASWQGWRLAALIALGLVARQRTVPTLDADGTTRWRVSLVGHRDREDFDRAACHIDGSSFMSRNFASSRRALRDFLDRAADVLMRPTVAQPSRQAATDWGTRFVAALGNPDPRLRGPRVPIASLARALDVWAAPGLDTPGSPAFGLCVELAPPGSAGDEVDEDAEGDWLLSFHLQARSDPSLLIPLATYWNDRRSLRPLSGSRTLPTRAEVLDALGRISRVVPAAAAALKTRRPASTLIAVDEVPEVLTRQFPRLAALGVGVVVPLGLRPGHRQRAAARLRVTHQRSRPTASSVRIGMAGVLSFRYEVALGDDTLTAREFRHIVKQKRDLVRWRGRWILIDSRAVAQLVDHFPDLTPGTLSMLTGLGVALRLEGEGLRSPVDLDVKGKARDLLLRVSHNLREPGASGAAPGADIALTAELGAAMRPYQVAGVQWLTQMADLGLGALLADDMGLGKTCQALGLVRARFQDGSAPTLVVCPTSVIGQWERELARCSPTLVVLRHHGPSRVRIGADLRMLAASGQAVVLTSYPLLRQDRDLLASLPWGLAIFDEAQNLKNPQSLQYSAARSIPTSMRLALTGTPVENRLTDLWALMELLNPGLLGPLARFQRRFSDPIELSHDVPATRRLQALIGPFLLRRLKTDPTLVNTLPPRLVTRVDCALTREQATLYQAVIDEELALVTKVRGVGRRARMLVLMGRLQKILDHPAHFLGQTAPLSGRSGKLERLVEILEEALACGDSVLIYTHSVSMGHLLVAHLEDTFGRPVGFLHGQVSRSGRDHLVSRFQGSSGSTVMVLSVKAGGTGIDLTRARHVVLYDRWWNPAVEDQAADRAHRIGQTGPVQIHAFVSRGTLEEKIHTMIEDKRDLSRRVIHAGMPDISRLDDQALADLVRLADAVIDEPM